MAIEKVRAYFQTLGIEERILEFDVSSATVELAAAAVGVCGAQICKTLSFKSPEGCILIQMAGDGKVDNLLSKIKHNNFFFPLYDVHISMSICIQCIMDFL